MAPHEHLFKRMNLKPETHTAALALLVAVQARTAPGSGYNLGPHSTGLPALCAYVASQQLRNNDISEKVAQAASCLKPRDFAKTLGIVRTVLASSAAGDAGESAGQGSPSKRRRVGASPAKEKQTPRSSPRKAAVPLVTDATKSAPPGDDVPQPSGSAPRPSQPYRASRPTTPTRIDCPDEEEEDEEPRARRRFRPVFLDQAQWCARDPRLDRVWRGARAHGAAMVGLYGHPFERWRPGAQG